MQSDTLPTAAVNVFPRYQCHKQVGATKVTGFDLQIGGGSDTIGLVTDHGTFHFPKRGPGQKPTEYEVGGYVVQYDDGYTSYSPAKPFEDGYALIGNTQIAYTTAPATPTDAMLDVGQHVASEWWNDRAPLGEHTYRPGVLSIYQKMLAAFDGALASSPA